jgi:DNA polymerase-1
VLLTLLELRSVEKELRTYAEVELGTDGCVHPGFLPAGKDTDSFGKGIAGTGRITASNPNIQNQPQSARRMYVPHSPEQVLVEADFSQVEARIIAQLSGDIELRAAIAEGLHESNMRVFGCTKVLAKGGFYGWAYGMGARTMHMQFLKENINVPEARCGQLLDGFDARFALAAGWRRRVAAELSTRYYLTNAFGRRRYFLGGSRDTPAGLDFHPQSCAADIMWTVLRPLSGALRAVDARLLATVHDSILVECGKGSVGAAARIMKEIMEQSWPELDGLRVPVEIKTGSDWGSMTKMEGV